MMKIKIDMDDCEKKLKVALERSKVDIVNALQDRLTPEHGRFTSNLMSSISRYSKVEGNEIIIGMLEYGKFLEWGTPYSGDYDLRKTNDWSPKPRKMPPPDKLED